MSQDRKMWVILTRVKQKSTPPTKRQVEIGLGLSGYNTKSLTYEEISCMYYITSLVQMAMTTILNVVINIVKSVYKVH
jgi:hypothetical protein